MKTLFKKENVNEILDRVNKLTASNQKQWGKMNVDQMLAHCSIAMESAIGSKYFPQLFMGKLIGRFFKPYAVGEGPVKKNIPTNPAFIFINTEGFEKEKQKLIGLINQFHQGGEAKCTTNPHTFFGKLTSTEWGVLQYKHLNHHFSQFGV